MYLPTWYLSEYCLSVCCYDYSYTGIVINKFPLGIVGFCISGFCALAFSTVGSSALGFCTMSFVLSQTNV